MKYICMRGLAVAFAAACAFLSPFSVHAALSPSGEDDTSAIQAALDAGGIVELGEGEFRISTQLMLTNAVTLTGAGRDKTTIRQTLAHKSTNIEARVLKLDHADAVVQGVTITGGYTYEKHGAGVYIGSNGGKVLDCRVTDNESSMNDRGVVYLTSANGVIARTIIDKNKNSNNYPYSGVGLTMTAGLVESCLIAENYANGKNRAGTAEAGGVAISGGTLKNCTIVNNTGWNVGGVDIQNKNAKLVNCIIYGNKLSGSGATQATAPEYWCGKDVTADLSTTLVGDATFKNFSGGDYHIASGGAAANKGTGEEIFYSETDLDGNPREVGAACDYGCYESPGYDDWIAVDGSPEQYGQVSPAYGQYDGYKPNDMVTLSAPASVAEGGVNLTLTGWELQDAAGTVVQSGTDNPHVYTHTGPFRKFVWKWVASIPVTVSAGPGGTVSASASAVGYGETVTITATPDASLSGVSFFRWTGDVPDAQKYENPLVLTVDAAKSVTAVFGTKKSYVSSVENPGAAFPYGSPETAANSIEEALAVTSDGGEIVCGAGTFKIAADVLVDRPVRIVGAGYESSTLDLNKKRFELNAVGAGLEGFDVKNVWIEWNASCGGVIVRAGTMSRCRFAGNTDPNGINSKGLCAGVVGDDARITHCLFVNNDATAKNTIGVVGVVAGLVDNCLFVGNKCQQGGALYLMGTGATVRNCTVTGNEATVGVGGGVYVDSNWGPVMENCIVYGNVAKTTGAEYYLNKSFSDLQKGHLAKNCCFGKGNGIGTDPIDANPSLTADCRLNVGSAGINAGVAYAGMTDDTDLGGDPRVVGDAIDLGCYEFVPSAEFTCSIVLGATSGLVGDTVTLKAVVGEGFDPADYTFKWTVQAADETTVPAADGADSSVTLNKASRYAVSLLVNDRNGAKVAEQTADEPIVILPAVVYLAAENENAAFPYDSEETASTNLVELTSLLVDGCRVVVLPGEHAIDREIEITKAIVIASRDGRETTTIRQTKSSRMFRLGNKDAKLVGLTMTGGFAYDSFFGVVRINGAGGTVDRCRITGCTCSMNSGGSLQLDSAGALAVNTIVDRNRTVNNYGNSPGVQIKSGRLESCLVVSNVVTECSMRKFNLAGGIAIGGGTVVNCTVADNVGRGVGGITFWDGYNWGDGKVVNTISYGNTASNPEYLPTAGQGDVNWCCNDSSKIVTCLFAEPSFRDAANGDYRLAKGSAAVNAGTYEAWMDAATDLAGKARVKFVKRDRKTGEIVRVFVDIGCYESKWSGAGFALIVR